MTAEAIIRALGLEPHPEGGWFRETWREATAPRGHGTAIYFLLRKGQRPQLVVPGGAWQAARSLGAFTLVGCTVSPAFVFEAFELAPPDWTPGDPRSRSRGARPDPRA